MSLCSLVSTTRAQVTCTPVFTNEYQANSNILPTAVKVLSDGTMLTAGKGLAGASSNYDGFVARLNPDGSQIWSFFIGGNGNDVFSGIAPLNDGTTMLYGSTQSFGHPEGQGWLVHIDANGAVLSSYVLGSSTTVNGWVKAVEQYTDGDIAGTFNVNDGSAASDPVVFKMGLNGTLRWTQRFDDGNADSFTGIAFSGDTLYAAGYYTAGGAQQAIITLLNITSGSYLSSTNISYGGTAYQEQITGLQIYGGTISYGLYVTGASGGAFLNEIILVQTDLAGNLRFPASYASDMGSDLGGSTMIEPVRTADSGFYVLRTGSGTYAGPGVAKINKYGVEEWGLVLAANDEGSTMDGIDVTSDGGCVAVGWFNTYLAGFSDIMRLVKITAAGQVSSCNLSQESMATGTTPFQQNAFTWASQPAINPLVQAATPNAPVAAPMTLLADPENPTCSGSVCVDNTPVPAGCNKTYNIAYASDRSSTIYDVIPTTDGGRVAVGGLQVPTTYQAPDIDGLVVKYQSNGAVAWAMNYNTDVGSDLTFARVVLLADGNMLAIGNSYDIYGGYDDDIVMMKFGINGNVLWVKYISEAGMTDIGATPDGGFVLVGGSIVIRYDANANMIWQETTTHQADIPQYVSVFCSGNYVDIAFHSITYSNQFGVDRLNLTTGAEVWSQAYATNSTSTAINRIISKNDSVYLFAYNYIQYAAAPVTNLVIKLDTLGKFYQAQTLGAGLNVTVNVPSVTLTSDGNFALANQVPVAGGNSFLLTKLQPDGTVLWSNNFTSIPYQPYNLHTQGKGFIIPGVQAVVQTGNPNFTNSIMLKLDSSGQFETGAAAGCQATPSAFVVSPFGAVGSLPNALSSVLPATLPVTNGSVFSQNATVSATLLCYSPGNCNAVTMEQKGTACAVGDTLVYYLDNSSNCGAAAAWNYNPTLFRPGITSGDSIQLIVLQGGSSTVSAQVEGYCSLTLQSTTANIVLSTTNLSLGPDTVVCDNASINLVATPGFASYLWDNNSTGSSLVVTAPGTYYVTAADQCGGLHSDTVLVTAADSLFHLTPDTISCNQDRVVLQASSGYTDYQWSPAYNLQPQGSEALVSPGITTLYTVTALRSPGCTMTRSVQVTALSSPSISLGNDTSICSGDSLLLDAGPLFNSYQWSTGATGENIYVSQTGVYSLSALYSNGCASRDTFQLLSLYTIVRPSLDQDSVLCFGTARTVNAGAGYVSYLWSNGSTGSSIDISQPGVYWVSVTDQHGCKAADTTNVLKIAALPAGFLPQDTTVCQYGNLVITTLQPYVSYSWSDLSAGPSLTVDQPGTYWLTVTDTNGCTGKDSIVVTGKECLVGLFVPNAFTPNGDGHNDRFRPLYYGNASQFEFAVFSRWGQRVFETKSPTSDGWDGTINGVPSPAGTYVWYCRYQPDGQPATMQKGTVILIR